MNYLLLITLKQIVRPTKIFAASLIFLCLSSPIHAVEESEKLASMVVVGSLASASTEDITSSVTVLTAQDIQRLNKSNVIDLLRTIPGVGISQQAGVGGASDLSQTGGESNYTVVFILSLIYVSRCRRPSAFTSLCPRPMH